MDRPRLLRRAFLLILSAAVLTACWLLPVDRHAREQVNAGLQRSLTAFAAARTLGAAVSVVQSVRVEAVVGVAPGEALRPLSELIDRFAAVMLAASVAFGVQLLLLGVGGHLAVSISLTAALIAWAVLRWRGSGQPEAVPASSRTLRWLTPVLIGLLMARFAVPLSALANEAAYRAVMAGEFQGAMAGLEGASARAEAVAAEPRAADEASKSTVERMRAWVERLKSTPAAIDALLQSAREWATQIVRLMAVFVLQTAVLPLAFVWLWWRIARGLVGAPLR
ncbi:hypothetical protein PGB34_22585 [Xenophilus arseniciresistens]|uniref:Uncharacterized protein n=1 Tax=Xenophilus arseniciresistens TaxID=1283306 RepID=A0AAE3NB91_9BURK|nr:hypothetical protein [Xenophilus arseniciresistens]MDA7419170.1 hypothetical protein [Xenophilus arseniciresistens]